MPIDLCWTTDFSFHCLFCHGYEDRGAASAGVLAVGKVGNVGLSSQLARMAKRLASKVTVYTNGAKDLGEQLVSNFATDVGITVDERPITRLEKGSTEPQVIVHFADGQGITEGFLVRFIVFSRCSPQLDPSLIAV